MVMTAAEIEATQAAVEAEYLWATGVDGVEYDADGAATFPAEGIAAKRRQHVA